MRKINLIADTSSHELWFETAKGDKLDIPYYFLNRIDLDGLMLYEENDAEGKSFPTLSDLTANGALTCVRGYVEVDFSYKTYRRKIDVKRIISFFKKNGFNVTKEAISHNFNAYLMDMKSGYRDDKNGYHLFTPCRHNPLSFRLTSLNNNCQWQKTYTC